MGNTIGNHKDNKTKHLTIGLLAHVDAGKTTLAESMLYASGSIRKAGRVDHGDAFLDTYALEKDRGITIFAKQAQMTLGQYEVTLLDTPGHVDFSAEMERTLQVPAMVRQARPSALREMDSSLNQGSMYCSRMQRELLISRFLQVTSEKC